MAWSYDETDLDISTASGQLNAVRLLLGDTDQNDQQTSNEEVIFGLAQTNSNVYLAAAWSARTVAAQYSRRVTQDLSGALSAMHGFPQRLDSTMRLFPDGPSSTSSLESVAP